MQHLLAVVVGCNYEDSGRAQVPPLHGAENDAQHMAALLQDTAPPNGALGSLTVLLGAEASTARLHTALLQAVKAQTGEDTVFLYFAGHGQHQADGLVLYTWDSEYHMAVLLQEFAFTGAPLRVVLDCCFAGDSGAGMVKIPPGFDGVGPDEGGDPFPGIPVGNIQILCAAGATEGARESGGQGVFTTALVAALRTAPAFALLTLPLQLQTWRAALPLDLLAPAAAPAPEQARNLRLPGAQVPTAHQTIQLVEGRVPQ
jgi:hypothetical protein